MGLVSLLFVFVNFGNTFINAGYATQRCSRLESYLIGGHQRYNSIYFCCGNHETIGNKCKECEAGFTSSNGDNCMKCKSGSYGKRCVDLCQCSEEQRCDHILGCVHIHKESNDEKLLSSTDNMIKGSETTADLSRKPGGSQASSNNNILIYCVCVFCTIIVMIFCNFCIRQLRQKEDNTDHRNLQMQGITGTSSHYSGRRLVLSGHNVYDEIDETALTMDRILNRTTTSNNESSSSHEEDIIVNDGYLNPYQPVVTYTDAHKYTTCIQTSNEMKASNSLPALLGCLKYMPFDCNCFEPMKDQAGKSLISHAGQHHTAINFLLKKNDRFFNVKQKRRRSI